MAIRHRAVLFTGDAEILAIGPIVKLVDLRRASAPDVASCALDNPGITIYRDLTYMYHDRS